MSVLREIYSPQYIYDLILDVYIYAILLSAEALFFFKYHIYFPLTYIIFQANSNTKLIMLTMARIVNIIN